MFRFSLVLAVVASGALAAGSVAVSPPAARNGLIAFVDDLVWREPGSRGELYAVSVATRRIRDISLPDGDDSYATVSPDGRRVAFVSTKGFSPALYVARVDGSALHIVEGTAGRGGASMAWSPNSRRLAFTVGDELFIAAASGGSLRSLGPGRGPISWSPEGSRLAFTAAPNGGTVIVATSGGHRFWTRRGDEARWAPRGGRLSVVIVDDATRAANTAITNARGRVLARFAGKLESWSPDGRRIVVRRGRYGYVSPWSGRHAVRLADVSTHAWSPDSRRIVFAGQRRRTFGVWVASAAGGSVRHISRFAYVGGWSPLNRILLATGVPVGSVAARGISVIRPDGRGLKRLVQAPAGVVLASVAFADRGRTVVYHRSGRGSDLFAVEPDGTGLQRLTFDARPKSSPAWSPDGTRVAYSVEDCCGLRIYVTRAGAGRSEVVGGSKAFGATWAPDGRRIAYGEYGPDPSAGGSVFVASLDGSGATRIAAGDSPAWSPTGSEIAFVAAGGEISLVDADGSDLRHLVDGRSPAWSPDGVWIAYVDAAFAIRAVHPDGSGDHLLFEAGADRLAWSPDGGRIAYATSAHNIYVADTDGSGKRLLTTGTWPTWQPLPD